jgi:hypothetical protein
VVVKRCNALFFVSVFHVAGRISVRLKAGDFPAIANCSMAVDNRRHGVSRDSRTAMLYFEVSMYTHLEV